VYTDCLCLEPLALEHRLYLNVEYCEPTERAISNTRVSLSGLALYSSLTNSQAGLVELALLLPVLLARWIDYHTSRYASMPIFSNNELSTTGGIPNSGSFVISYRPPNVDWVHDTVTTAFHDGEMPTMEKDVPSLLTHFTAPSSCTDLWWEYQPWQADGGMITVRTVIFSIPTLPHTRTNTTTTTTYAFHI
jgi:hypothetical protein